MPTKEELEKNFPEIDWNVIDRVRDRKDFPETMIVVWGLIEFFVNIIFVEHHNLDYFDPQATRLIQRAFSEKIELLKNNNDILPEEFESLDKLRERRNDLFHSRRGKELLYFTIGNDEKNNLMELAWKSLDITIRVNVLSLASKYF